MNLKGMKVVCIIPARGGSKGLINKNTKQLNGRPLIAWSIESALKSKHINAGVYVTSDCDTILAIATSEGAKAIKRPEELATDNATSESAILHALDSIDVNVDLVVFLQCTSPIRNDDDIDKAIQTLIQEQADSLLSVTEIKDYFVWGKGDTSAAPANFDHNNRKRRQDIPAQFLENGSIYVFRSPMFKEKNNRLGGKVALYEMDKFCSFQIDDEHEFAICEALLRGKLCGIL